MTIPLYQIDGIAIYAKLQGTAHLIDTPATLEAIFGPNPTIDPSATPGPTGFPIDSGSFLGASQGTVYLFTNGHKYGVTSQAAMDAHQFKGPLLVGPAVDWAAKLTPDGGAINES